VLVVLTKAFSCIVSMIPLKKLVTDALSRLYFIKVKACFIFPILCLSYSSAFAQPACTPSPTSNCEDVSSGSVYLMSSAANVDFTFDSFGKFVSGITINGATLLRLIVAEVAVPVTPCRWQLHANIDNGGVFAINEWEQITDYGNPGPPYPTVDLMQIRVRNACNTPLIGTGFNTLMNINQTLDIVDSPGFDFGPSGCAGTNVNRPGSYLTNYGEYSFIMDYRILPTFAFKPGVYQLNVRFCLSEDL